MYYQALNTWMNNNIKSPVILYEKDHINSVLINVDSFHTTWTSLVYIIILLVDAHFTCADFWQRQSSFPQKSSATALKFLTFRHFKSIQTSVTLGIVYCIILSMKRDCSARFMVGQKRSAAHNGALQNKSIHFQISHRMVAFLKKW
jgi:hypothetical protein